MSQAGIAGSDYRRWAKACRELNANDDKARLFREQRYAFTHRLAGLLVQNLPQTGEDQVIYAVRLVGAHARPVYLGTSSEARRRLWDLPVGESHHLSNTYPPEIWERVQVLHWRKVMAGAGEHLRAIIQGVSRRFEVDAQEAVKLIGMGIEFLFQKTIRPELNVRTKLRHGGFKDVDFEDSKSRQAEIARRWVGPVFPDLLKAWQQLETAAENCPDSVYRDESGSVVFPERVFNSR